MATIKQKKAAKALVGNGGNVTQAMLEAEYSPNTANTPQKLTESEGFKEIWNELIPKRLVVKVHKQLLEKKEIIRHFNHDTGEYEMQKGEQPHSDTVKAVDMAYKIDDAYAPEKHMNVNVELKANPIIEELAEKLNELLKQ